jgi:hypothetical protein
MLLMVEDLDWVAEVLQQSPNLPIDLIIRDYKARAASLRRTANSLQLTPEACTPTIPKKNPRAVPRSGSRADAGHPSPKTRSKAKRS